MFNGQIKQEHIARQYKKYNNYYNDRIDNTLYTFVKDNIIITFIL